MKTLSPKASLFIGLAIPVILVALIAAAVLLPGSSIEPKTDFLYAVGRYPTYVAYQEGSSVPVEHRFSVVNGKLTEITTQYPEAYRALQRIPTPSDLDTPPRFFIHHAETDTNTEISIEQAKELTLSTETESPEGLTVTFGSRSYGVFPFYSGSDDNRQRAYVSSGKASKRISLVSDISINYEPFQMVGWVLR